MARAPSENWKELQERFLSDHAESGISPKDWCESRGINYTSARRHIKTPSAPAVKSAQIAQEAEKAAQKRERIAQMGEDAYDLACEDELSERVQIFIAEYLKDLNASKAAARAGYSKKSAGTIGYQLLQKPLIAHEIAQRQKSSLMRTIGSADEVLAQIWGLATFDANEISQYRRGCCRHCWGVDHRYQWTEFEYQQAAEKAERQGKQPPDDSGGMDYCKTHKANPECPACGGEGVGRVYIADTRELSPIARLAYSGTKITKGGIEVMTINRERMFEAIIKRLGLADNEIAMKIQRLELERRELELRKLRDELANVNEDLPITEMEVTVVSAKDMRNDDSAAG